MSISIQTAIFPEVNVTRLESLDFVKFQQDDILFWPCGGHCPFAYDQTTAVFPGAIVAINGESVACGINPRAGAEHRIFSIILSLTMVLCSITSLLRLLGSMLRLDLLPFAQVCSTQ